MPSGKSIAAELLALQLEKAPQEDLNEALANDFEAEDIQAVIDRIAPRCQDVCRASFSWHYDIGAILRDHYEIIQMQRESMYGERFFRRVARDLGNPGICGVLLSSCRELARAYTRDECLEFHRYPALTPTHILQVVRFDAQDRNKLIQAVIDHQWGPELLFAEIWDQHGPRQQEGACRPPQIDMKLRAAYDHMHPQPMNVLDSLNRALPGAAHCGDAQPSKTPAPMSNDIEASLRRALQLATQARDALEAFNRTYDRVEDKPRPKDQ